MNEITCLFSFETRLCLCLDLKPCDSHEIMKTDELTAASESKFLHWFGNICYRKLVEKFNGMCSMH